MLLINTYVFFKKKFLLFLFIVIIQIDRGMEQLGSSSGSNPEVVGSNPTPATNLQMKKDTNNEIVQIFFNRSFNTTNYEL